MSVAVELTELAERIREYGPAAYLVSLRPEGRPHVVSVSVAWRDDDRLVAGAGSRTSANVGDNPSVTLVWASRPGDDYCLLVDGTARVDDDGEHVTIAPTAAVLHRVADASDESVPSCVRLLPDQGQASTGG